jgi:hypothetical protein
MKITAIVGSYVAKQEVPVTRWCGDYRYRLEIPERSPMCDTSGTHSMCRRTRCPVLSLSPNLPIPPSPNAIFPRRPPVGSGR